MRGVVAAGLGLLLLGACDRRPAPVQPDAAPAAAVAATLSVPPAASKAPVVGATAVVDASAGLPPTLADFFAGYRDGSTFEFLRADCRPTMDRFVSLKNVGVDAAIRDARTFFHDRRQLSYRPDVRQMRVEAHADGESTVRLPVTMAWTYPVPKGWGDDFPAGGPDGTAVVSRSMTVDVEVTLDADGRIAQYVEAHVQTPRLRVTHPEKCADVPDHPGVPWVAVSHGMIVQDLGETLELSMSAKGPATARKVRANGQDGWTMESVCFAVSNPYGGTSAGMSSCLELAGDAGKP
jgi:hypothetical protein